MGRVIRREGRELRGIEKKIERSMTIENTIVEIEPKHRELNTCVSS